MSDMLTSEKTNGAQGIGDVTEADAQQYLSFELGDENYAVEILRVQEIRGWNKPTPIPNAPGYLCGVLNLRGDIVPIVDLRLFFGMPPKDYTQITVVIVLRIKGDKHRTVGIVVDAVSEAQHIAPEQIKITPDFGNTVKTHFITGIATLEDSMLMLLDIDKLLTGEQLG